MLKNVFKKKKNIAHKVDMDCFKSAIKNHFYFE